MPDLAIEREGLHFKVHDNGDGTFAFTRHDTGGGLLATDRSLEIQGLRIQCHDNGDGTFSMLTTTTTSASDPTLEFQGLHMRVHPTGNNDPNTGEPMYAIVVVNV